MRSTRNQLVFASAIAAWLATAVWGMKLLGDKAHLPSDAGTPEVRWPATSSLEPAQDRCTLVLGLHPECPCSRATLEELNALLAQGRDTVRIFAIFENAGAAAEPMEDSELWRTAGRLPGVHCVSDRDGAEARRFALKTSGEVRVYGANGALRFRGGITGSRGHVGDNPGREAALAAIRDRNQNPGTVVVTPVFGCALSDEKSAEVTR